MKICGGKWPHRIYLAAVVAIAVWGIFVPSRAAASAAPGISAQPQSQSVIAGSNAVFTVVASGQMPLFYQWSLNGTNLTDNRHINGATGATLTVSNVVGSDVGNYRVVVSNSHGSVTSINAALTVLFPPSIAVQPANQEIVLGKPATFTVAVSGGGPLWYQWYFGGNLLTNSGHIDGANSSTLTVFSIVPTDVGYYQVMVSNTYGRVISSNAALTLMPVGGWGDDSSGELDTPMDLTNAVSVAAGFVHSLALRADGTVEAWGDNQYGQTNVPSGLGNVIAISAGYYFNAALKSDGTVVAWGDNSRGETNVPSGLSNVIAITAQAYHAIAEKADGTIVEWGYYQGQNGLPVPPTNLNNLAETVPGGAFTLAVAADGTTISWGGVPSDPAPVFPSVSNIIAGSAGESHCVVLTSLGSLIATGSNYYGQLDIPPEATNVISVAAGVNSTLALKVDSTVVGCGWFSSPTPPVGLSNVVTLAAGGLHNLVLFGSGPPRIITATYPPLHFNVGNAMYLNALAVGQRPIYYQWQCNGIQLVGQTNHCLALTNLTTNNIGNYTLVVTNSFGAVTNDEATITVESSPNITAQTSDQSVLLSSNAVFSVSVTGAKPLNYQWYFNGTPLMDGGGISGSTGATLTISNVQASDYGDYQLVVTNSYGAVTSAVTVLTVLVPAGVVTQPTNLTLLPGATAVFSVMATGTGPLGYQWLKDGTILTGSGRILGTAGSTLTISNAQFSDIGHYSVTVSNTYGTIVSSQASLVVVPVVAWGDNSYGEANIPVAFTNTLTISTEGYTVEYLDLGLKGDGTVAAWGYNYYNEFGDTYFGQTNLPAGLSNVIQVSAGFRNGLALKSDGTVVCLGDSSFGEATPPVGLNNVANVAAGGLYSLALRSNGTVVGWGYNGSGATNVPAGLSNVLALDAGVFHSLAIKNDGTVAGWGLNDYGQAIAPAGLSNVVAVSAGSHHSLALKSDGTVVAWGYDYFGESDVPAGLSNVVAIAAGYYHSLALKSDGTVVGWGENDQGQATPPVGLSNVVAIAAGNIHSLALVRNPATQVPPVIRWQGPTGRSVVTGRSAIFLPFVTGSLPMSYQWYLNGAPLAGQTNRWLALTSIQTNQAGGYQFVVTNNYGGATSAPVTLSALVPVYIMVQPSNQVVTVSSNADFTVIANGTGFLNYQWYFNGVPLPNGGRVTGSTTANLAIANVQISDGGSYQVVVSNAYGTATSVPAVLGTTYGIPGVVHFVDVNSTNPTAPYTDRSTSATNIQAAINASSASASDTVLVSPGIYRESVNFNGKPVWLVSANGPANTIINPPAGSASITFGNGETSNSVVSGFTITNGGVSLSFSSPTIISNVLLNCGTAINCYFSSPYIFNNVISGGSGNGVYLQGADTAVVQGNLIQKNAGGIGMFAAGSPTIINNVIQNNQGTAIGMVNQSDANIVQNIIANNTGDGVNALVPSGARGPWLINNTIYSNSGNGIYEDGFISAGEIINNIVVGSPALNLSPWYGGNFAITLYNDFYSTNGNVYAGVTNVTGVNGNLSVNPLFPAYPYGNYHLQSSSPCINSGRNNYVVGTGDLDGKPRIKGGTVDLGVYEYQTPASVISFAWLQQYGLPTDGSVDYADLDGTGFNVYQDWIAGLNPTNALSVLKMLTPLPTNNPAGVVVTWQSVTNVTYFLQRNGSLSAPFSPVQSNIVGQAGTTTYMDGSATNGGPYFYRVGVQ